MWRQKRQRGLARVHASAGVSSEYVPSSLRGEHQVLASKWTCLSSDPKSRLGLAKMRTLRQQRQQRHLSPLPTSCSFRV